jgi:LAGLIDADG DNA endonuclease family
MSDGVSNQYGLTLCTDSFTVKDTITLINILKLRFNLDCSLHYYSKCKYPRIYIKASSMNQLRLIVERHIIPFSQYKLHKGRR